MDSEGDGIAKFNKILLDKLMEQGSELNSNLASRMDMVMAKLDEAEERLVTKMEEMEERLLGHMKRHVAVTEASIVCRIDQVERRMANMIEEVEKRVIDTLERIRPHQGKACYIVGEAIPGNADQQNGAEMPRKVRRTDDDPREVKVKQRLNTKETEGQEVLLVQETNEDQSTAGTDPIVAEITVDEQKEVVEEGMVVDEDGQWNQQTCEEITLFVDSSAKPEAISPDRETITVKAEAEDEAEIDIEETWMLPIKEESHLNSTGDDLDHEYSARVTDSMKTAVKTYAAASSKSIRQIIFPVSADSGFNEEKLVNTGVDESARDVQPWKILLKEETPDVDSDDLNVQQDAAEEEEILSLPSDVTRAAQRNSGGSTSEKSAVENKSLYMPSGGKLFMCNICSVSFARLVDLSNHRVTHTSSDLFKCTRCNKTFQRKHQLAVHVKQMHAKDKPFACGHCGLHYSHRESFQVHMMTHTWQKPFTCRLCLEAFPNHKAVQTHMKTHASGKSGKIHHKKRV